MTKLLPIDSAKGGHTSVAEMARDLLADDPEFVKEFETHLRDRQLVKALAVVRARAGLSQQEVAAKMKCGQAKISKLENGVDADVRVGDVAAYLEATGYKAKVFLVPAGGTLVDEVKMHAFQIKQLLDRMVHLAGTDGMIAHGVADFLGEAACNLMRIIGKAAGALPPLPVETSRSVQVEAPEPDETDEQPVVEKRSKRRSVIGTGTATKATES